MADLHRVNTHSLSCGQKQRKMFNSVRRVHTRRQHNREEIIIINDKTTTTTTTKNEPIARCRLNSQFRFLIFLQFYHFSRVCVCFSFLVIMREHTLTHACFVGHVFHAWWHAPPLQRITMWRNTQSFRNFIRNIKRFEHVNWPPLDCAATVAAAQFDSPTYYRFARWTVWTKDKCR